MSSSVADSANGFGAGERAFTLLELSVVLVIIGLLTGGILAGQSLIRQSEINSAWADVRRYTTAVYNFKTQYQAFPGDFPRAVQLWGAAAGNAGDNYTTSCYGNAGAGTQTCNGDGNGQINYPTEEFLVWQHLAAAGLIEGKYDGQVLYPAQPGVNIPAGRISGAGFSFWDPGASTYSDSNTYPSSYGKSLIFGTPSTYQGDVGTGAPASTAEEAYLIDKKYDDGLPATGNVLTFLPGGYDSPNCATSSTPAQALYNTANTGVTCSLIFSDIVQ